MRNMRKGRRYSLYLRGDEQDLIEWLDEKIRDGTFRNPSHAFSMGLRCLKERMDKKIRI